jgi:1-acyl-sn-glycerol-3-phosphate acyltransferase
VIRTLRVYTVMVAATLYYGAIVIAASLRRVRGRVYDRATRDWARTVLRASGAPVTVSGAEHIAEATPRVIVANHVDGYDIFALASVLDVPFRFVAKKELERIPFFGRAWKAAGHISIDRGDRQRAIESLRRAGKAIREDGSSVIIFPEGTRSKDGRLHPFKKGAFALAIEAQVPVVPAAITGTFGIIGRRGRIRPRPIHIDFGAPILPGDSAARTSESLATAAHDRIAKMLVGVERGRPASPNPRSALR